MSGEAAPVPMPWTCTVVFTLDDHAPVTRVVRGPTAADAAALARMIAERAIQGGVWVSAYTLLPPHRIDVITLADPVKSAVT